MTKKELLKALENCNDDTIITIWENSEGWGGDVTYWTALNEKTHYAEKDNILVLYPTQTFVKRFF